MSALVNLNTNFKTNSIPKRESRVQFKNEEAAFKIAKGYFKEFLNKNITSFAFSSVSYKNSQQKAILAVSCYFSQVQGQRVSIVTDNLDGVFSNICKKSLEVEIISPQGHVISGYQFNGMYIFDTEKLLDLCKDEKVSLESVLETIKDYSDVSFFDLPELETIKEFLSLYKPLLNEVESLSVVYFEDNDNQIVEEVYGQFDRNGICLRGGLVQMP
jgi:hypothetical protein